MSDIGPIGIALAKAQAKQVRSARSKAALAAKKAETTVAQAPEPAPIAISVGAAEPALVAKPAPTPKPAGVSVTSSAGMGVTRTLIIVEMLLLWLGTIDHYKKDYRGSIALSAANVGIRTVIPVGLLTFWLLLLADLGAGGLAALIGGIIAYTYILGSLTLLTDITDAMLAISKDLPTPASSGAGVSGLASPVALSGGGTPAASHPGNYPSRESCTMPTAEGDWSVWAGYYQCLVRTGSPLARQNVGEGIQEATRAWEATLAALNSATNLSAPPSDTGSYAWWEYWYTH